MSKVMKKEFKDGVGSGLFPFPSFLRRAIRSSCPKHHFFFPIWKTCFAAAHLRSKYGLQFSRVLSSREHFVTANVRLFKIVVFFRVKDWLRFWMGFLMDF